MRLLEHEAKQLLKQLGIATPHGAIARTPADAGAIAEQVGKPVVVKAQVPVGGRGKAGGIKFANTPAQAIDRARELLGSAIGGHRVECVLVEEQVLSAQEYYASVALDWIKGQKLILLSASGGIEIESKSAASTEAVVQCAVDPLTEFPVHEARNLARKVGLKRQALVAVADVLVHLVQGAASLDLLLAEINPLFLLPDGCVMAGDAKVEVDDSARSRQRAVLNGAMASAEWSLAAGNADGAQIAYVPLDGDIGIIAGGAGLALATMDTVFEYGGQPADFLDIGGGGSSELVARALRMLLARGTVRGIVINVYGGINNCEVMARGIVDVCMNDRPSIPIVVKMRGHFQEKGWAMLEAQNIPIVKKGTTDDAVKLIMSLVNGVVMSETHREHASVPST